MGTAEGQVALAESTKATNFVARFWRGEYSLGVSYWLFGIGTNVLLYVTALAIGILALALGANEHLAVLATLPTSVALMSWYSGGVWSSADNHSARTGRKGWATVAKVMLVIGWLSILGQLGNALEH